MNTGEPIVSHPELTNKESSLTKPVPHIEDTSPLESAVALANSWEDLPKSALRAMFEARNGRQRTRITHEQLAAIVGGTTDVLPFRTPFVKNAFATRSGIRLHDVMVKSRFIEPKLGGDRVTPLELEKDCFLISLGVSVEYHFVCNPLTGEYHNPLDIKVLENREVPYKVWGWGFWNP
jgi:hypothetical protein